MRIISFIPHTITTFGLNPDNADSIAEIMVALGMSRVARESRAAVITRHHIWDGDNFRPLKPTAPFQPQTCRSTGISSSDLPQREANGPKLLPRREFQWVLTRTGAVTHRRLASSLVFMTSIWETLISSVESSQVEGDVPPFAHTEYPRGILTCQVGEEEEGEEEAERDEGGAVGPAASECPVRVKPKAKPVMQLSREYHTCPTPRTSSQGRLLPLFSSGAVAEDCLRQALTRS